MAGELKLHEVATPSTPGSTTDAVYMTNATPGQLGRVDSAGTIWYYPATVIQQLTANYVLTSSSSAQQALNGSANGQITLPASQGWQFEATYLLTNTGTTSHTWAIGFGGTATLTNIAYAIQATQSATSNAIAAVSAIYGTSATPVVSTAASTSATENVIFTVYGTVLINGAGTFIPQIKASAAPGGTSTILAGSYFKMWQTGSNTNAYIGNWS